MSETSVHEQVPSVSVVGIGLRLPGARDKKEYFELLKEGRCAIGRVPADRWNADAMTQLGGVPGKVVTDKGGFVHPHTEIDSLEFGISPAESKSLDPHQLMLVECVFQALEDSGVHYRGTNTGVYVTGSPDVHNLGNDMWNMGPYSATGAAFSMQANRLSYLFDLRGPSVYLDTACSSSITCLHLARTAILRGDCDMAVVAAVNLILAPHASLSFSTLGTLSPTGLCHTFDASADGYSRGEGCTVIILQRTPDAVRLGSHIYSEITGSSINANGKGKSITLPDGPQQKAATYAAYKEANRSPTETAYVECHGTGTPVGDPIEANAVGEVFTPGREKGDYLRIGSAKTNVGHLEPAAGLVGLIKNCYTLDMGLLLPHLHFNEPSPKIRWDDFLIQVQTKTEPLPSHKLSKDGKFIVSLSSFGFGGANSHTVMERVPNQVEEQKSQLGPKDPMLVAVGALSNRAVTSLANAVSEMWSQTNDPLAASLLARTMTERARGHPNVAFAVGSMEDSLSFSDTVVASTPDLNPIKAFVFCGQGPQHEDMGRHLYVRFAAFRESVNKSFEIVARFHKKNFQEEYGLFNPEAEGSVAKTESGGWTVECIVIAITIFQIALFDLWVDLGVTPDVVMGHSVGEIAAMYASGALSHELAIRTAIARSNALTLLDTVDGQMAALGMGREEAQVLIERIMKENNTDTGLWVSASNSTNAVSVSGKTSLLQEVVKDCESRGIFARHLRVGGPYHSPMVSPCGEPFLKEVYPLVDASVNVPKTRFISTVDGRLHDVGQRLDAEYCWKNVCQPVLFRESIEALHQYRKEQDRGLLIIEIAPHSVLGSYMEEITNSVAAERTTIVSCARRPNFKKGETKDTPGEITQFLTAVGGAIQSGVRDLVVYKLYGDKFVDRPMGVNSTIDVPAYPFLPLKKTSHEVSFPEHLRIRPVQPPLSSPTFRINAQTHSWTKGHMIRGTIVFPGAGYAEAALEAGARTITNMQIHRAFVLEEEGAPKYASFKMTGINGGWEFRSSGKNSVNDAGIIFDQLHASGQMMPESTPLGPSHIEEVFGKNWIEHFDIVMDGETFYQRLRPNGSMHTGAFGMIKEVRASTTREDDYIALVDVLPGLWTHRESEMMVFHPGLLDSAFLCTWIPALPFDGTKLGVDAFLPNHLDILTVRATPEEIRASKQLVLYVQTLISNDQNIKHNILMFDRATGKTLAFLKGLECTRIKDTAKEREGYTESWEPRAFDATETPADTLTLQPELTTQFLADMRGKDESGVMEQALAQGTVAGTPLQDQVLDLPGVSVETYDSLVTSVQRMIDSSRAKVQRFVFRVLELYPRHRKANLQPLLAWGEKRGVAFDLVRLNVASSLRGSDAFETGPYDVAQAIKDSERTIPASFDIIIATDVLRNAADAQAAVKAVDELLVPGGYSVFAEVNAASPLGAMFYPSGSSLSLEPLGLRPYGQSPAFSLAFRQRDTSAWPCIPHIPSSPTATTGPFRPLASDELLFYHELGTEHLLPAAIKQHWNSDTPVGKMWIVTDDTVEGAAALGLAGTLTNEFMTIKGIYIAVDPSMSRAERDGLIDLLREREEEGSLEMFNVIRHGRLYGRRLIKLPSLHPTEFVDQDWVLELIEGMPASVQAVAPHTHYTPFMSVHDVKVQTDAVALNFKNILSATGLLPATDRLSEFTGIVTEVGRGVTRVRVGDRVMGTAGSAREGNTALASEYAVTKVPENMSPLEAAAYPIAYGTVWHGLVQLAQIRAGETILIHAAAGGVGLCAIQIAQRKGLEVFCTVSSQEKRDYLHNNLGVPYENMANSRSIAAWQQGGRDWLAKRGKTGFDVVLNSLQGAALQGSIEVLDYLGRFVDISKRDHLAGNPMSMGVFSKAINYIAVELGLLGVHAPQRMAALLDEIAAEHAREPFKCLFGHKFEGAEGLVESYRLMESGKHIGKIVTDLSASCRPGHKEKLWCGYKLYDPRKSYVLVGGCGGLGPRLAQFMINLGARNIVLTGRRGHISRSDRLALERLVRDPAFPHVTIKIMAADALRTDAMEGVFDTARKLAPIGGVFLMSVVLRDDQFMMMDKEKFDTVMNSKVGALNVIRQTLNIDELDFLFLFSSTAALFFNPGQANYNAAQAYFNRFALERRNVISYAVPAISDIGVYAQMRAKSNNAALKVMDALACTSRELCTMIAQAISRLVVGGTNHNGYFIQPMDWEIMHEISPANAWSISHLVEHHDDAEDDSGDDSENADPVGVLLGKLLNVDITTVDDTMFLSTLGLDSLSASKLSAILLAEFGCTVTQLQLLGPVSVSGLRDIVAETQTKGESASGQSGSKKAVAAKVEPPKTAQSDSAPSKVDTSAISTFDYSAEPEKLDDLPPSLAGLVPFDPQVLSPEREQHIFITGATGYMGATVLSALLDAFPHAQITALVRGTEEGGLDRIREVAMQRGLSTVQHMDRVKVLVGDMTKPKLGLSMAQWALLATGMDLLVHAGGKADHLIGYQGIYEENTLSTREVLRLASDQKVKAVVNIGSTNMWLTFTNEDRSNETVLEDVNLDDFRTGLFNGYSQSKWVAEKLCQRARARGLPVITVRPGVLGGNAYSKYVPNEDSFLWRMINACQQLGYAPASQSTAFTETPADWFAETLGKLLASPKTWTSGYSAFHIRNETPLKVESFPTRDGVARPQTVPYDEWVELFQKEASKPNTTNPLAPLRQFVAKGELAHLPHFDQSHTREMLGARWTECPPYHIDL
ncbi:Type I Iterative PKS [Malassezia nana]|uniref:Type I Iterative PKS n=1 Tax=Malassezia nana TaxID=180528 RepID=A0AAF0EII8_9BASI|nr:Type I Iterative PKS [Malassezia nana]